ncbi:cellulase [Polynucleobacter paneuropaeus]|nr:cellulase [Polynucleobacter paneuropaeus]MBT8553849.1 cellulase [Polynucleobacter paneuropaeus]MBT8559127.1 cellulase [Polynucleobacter paneuropaeus]
MSERNHSYPTHTLGIIFSLKKLIYSGILIISLFQISTVMAANGCENQNWVLWETFKSNFIKSNGRVVAGSSPELQSHSEGQAYAMVFSLVANDPKTFESIWRWTIENLAYNNLETKLPAWSWGKSSDSSWKVLDENSASDADLWLAYALLEAGRLWHRNEYIRDANHILMNVKQKSIVSLPGFGKMLLPGPIGFATTPNLWQLNPSYLPIPVLRRLAINDKPGPWSELANNTAKMIAAASPKGLAPDWIDYQSLPDHSGYFLTDPNKGDAGSYDAIRVYLWAGMTPAQDSLATPIMNSINGMQKYLASKNIPPEIVNTNLDNGSGVAPLGFSAALLPYLHASGKNELLRLQLERAQLIQDTKQSSGYYDYVLGLFGLGWYEKRYHFSSNGQLSLNWNLACTKKIN